MSKEKTEINYRDLATRFYTLDTDVYETSGSELGKVFPGDKHISVKQIVKDMEKQDTDKLQDELILIRNMIQTVSESEKYEDFKKRYDELSKDMDIFFEGKDEICDQISADFTQDKVGLMYKGENDHVVICIARQTGAGGHEIGYRLAKRLGYAFYDDEIMGIMIDEIEDNFFGMGGKDAHYIKQSQVIQNIAKAGDCVIVGRSCGHVLMVHNIPRLSVFIGAPYENRVRRKMLIEDKNRKEVEDLIKRSDKKRKTHYNYYTGKKWGNPADFDICLNSACYGIDGSVDLIERLVKISLNKEL
jgi:cytidylate kinase